MGAFGTVNNVVSLLYLGFAVMVVVRLVRAGKRTFDAVFTADDRRLAGSAAFYLATPIAVALHELGHAVATWVLGGRIVEFHYMVYWGYVVPDRFPPFSSWENAVTALAGNAVTLAIGYGLVLWTWRMPINAAWNFFRLELARMQLGLVLAFYPIVSLALQVGDFAILRHELNRAAPHVGDAALAAWAALAIGTWWLWRYGPWRSAYIRLATPLFDSTRAANARLRQNPRDPDALRDLGRMLLASGDIDRAIVTLRAAVASRPDDPATRFLLGAALLEGKSWTEATEHLRQAGQLLESAPSDPAHDALRIETTLALAAARLALGDAEGAILTVEAARAERPNDPRAVLLHADALTAAGRQRDATRELETALANADDALALEIRRRLEKLGPVR